MTSLTDPPAPAPGPPPLALPAVSTTERARLQRPSANARRASRTGALLTLPALVLVVSFAVVPIGFAVVISLTDWPLFGEVAFVGLDNYTDLASNAVFWSAVRVTAVYTAIVTLPILVIGYCLAALVRGDGRSATVFRTLFFLPYVVGLATLAFLALVEFQPGSGLVNVTLEALGLSDGQTAWFLQASTGMAVVCVLVIWFAAGSTMVLLLGGMQGISEDVYEAAELDGATRLQRELFITVPLLRRFIAMSLVISLIGSFLAFQQFLILTRGGPGRETTTLVMLVQQEAFVAGRVGSATAMGIVVMAIIAALTFVQLFVLRDRDA